MSYLITTPNDKLLVIDGGTNADEEYLREQIKLRGNIVDLWIITHCHFDHTEAFMGILENPKDIKIKKNHQCECYCRTKVITRTTII
jgi:glyoxylase-like metal-dependent hydrolase (beta-lactamase superfamily II)